LPTPPFGFATTTIGMADSFGCTLQPERRRPYPTSYG
jgi:hypothetical protein